MKVVYYTGSSEVLAELINRLVSHQPFVSKKTLDETLKLIVNDVYKAEFTDIIKKLIFAGATTEKISLYLVQKNNDRACNSIFAIVKASEKFYKNENLLKKYGKEGDLHLLVDTTNGYSFCKESVLLIIKYNPNLINRVINDGITLVYNYFSQSEYQPWEVDIAKLLMTKENINIHTRYGETPLYLLLRNNESFNHPEIIRYALTLGADLDIKTSEGITVREMILKRPALAAALRDVVKPK